MKIVFGAIAGFMFRYGKFEKSHRKAATFYGDNNLHSRWIMHQPFLLYEDPDGTLIELVETHKVPILKKMVGFWIYEKIRKKPLPIG
jgi:hypothetical protein